ncbi:MAG: hypothetical protein IPP94_00115 [Ignavibacteria bacterium]|nr:hypothetical protein [Ignavibacteria bacterium]
MTSRLRDAVNTEGRAPFFFVCIGMLLLAAPLAAQTGPFRVERLSADRWRISIENSAPRILPPTDDLPCSQVTMAGCVGRNEDGGPRLPFKRFPFAVPPGGTLRAVVRQQQDERLDARLVSLPQPSAAGAAGRAAGPQPAISVSAPLQRDGLIEQAVEFRPARHEDAAGSLVWVRSMVVDVTIDGAVSGAGMQSSRGLKDPFILNADDASAWRTEPVLLSASAPRWFQAGESMMKMRFTEAGVYRLTKSAIEAAGLATAGIDPRTFRVFLSGNEAPIRVEGEDDGRFDDGDYLEFHAPRHAGADGEWFDLWSDDNAAFLRWGGEAGRRFAREDATPPGTPAMTSAYARLHLEEDHEYHFGDHKETDVNISEYLPGETWMWRYLQKKDSLVIPFRIPHITQDTAFLTFRIKHSSLNPVRVRVAVNGKTVTEYDISDNEMSTRTVPLPAGLLRAGVDSLVFVNTQIVACPDSNPTCSIERMYVDWAEIVYPVPTVALGDRFLFDASARPDTLGPATRRRIDLNGVSRLPVRGINITAGAQLDGMLATGSPPDAGVSAGIRNTDSYIFYSDTAVLAPAALTLVTPPDLAVLAKDAEYIVVTHRAFRAAADRLAQYRAGKDGMRTLVADVDDLYDLFNFGRKHPVAIRAFLREAAAVSGRPPRFVTLMGDASWDGKFRMGTSSMEDFVPAWGNPAADNYYAALSDTLNDYAPVLSLGRIPAKTLDEAQAVVDKVIEYEALPPSARDNRFLLSVGGKYQSEQDWYLKPFINGVIRDWLTPFCLEPRLIVKSNPTLPVTYDDLDTLVSEANRGVNWFYFVGHGGSRIIDVGVERPDIFSLKGKYLFFVTMSCNTAHFAEPYETGLNERFILERDNGAIATYGTSGLGDLGHDETLSDGLFESMLVRNHATYGEMTTYAKNRLIASTGPGDAYTRNTVLQYALFGDPATHLPLAKGVDLAVEARDIATLPEIITQLQPTRISAVLANYGRCLTDSVDVSVAVEQGAQVLFSNTRRLPPFALRTLQEWTYDFRDAVGPVTITVRVATPDSANEARLGNNSASITRNVQPRGVRQIFPEDHALVSPAAVPVTFVVANPSEVPPASENPRIEVQIDPMPSFIAAESLIRAVEPVYTWFDWTPPAGRRGTNWWRSRMVTNAGPEPWSASRAFTIDTSKFSEDWRIADSAQFAACALDAVTVLPGKGGVTLGQRPVRVDVLSAGANQVEINGAALRVDGKEWALTRGTDQGRGFHIAVIDSASGAVVDTALFDTYADRANATAMAAYLDQVPAARTIAVAVKEDANGYPPVLPGGTNIIPALKDALKRFGARLIDSLGFNDSYAFIGSKGRPGRAKEMWARYGIAQAKDTVTVHALRGTVTSSVIGPANSWDRVLWEVENGSSSRVDLRVYGAGQDRDTLLATFDGATGGGLLALDAIVPASLHPFIRLQAVLVDSLNAGTPLLRALGMSRESRFPEIGITSQVVSASADSVEEGTPVTVTADVYNAGSAEVQNLPVQLAMPLATGARIVTGLIPMLPAGRGMHARVEFSLPTAGVRGEFRYDLDVNPGNRLLEYYYENDVYSRRIRISKDGAIPDLQVRFDDVEIADNDYVAPEPVITIKLFDDSPLPVTDTSGIQIFLDGRRVWLNANPLLEYTLGGGGREKARIRFTPDLRPSSPGPRLHTLAVSGRDASGNSADTVPYQVRFYVTLEDRIDEVLAYPNPSRGATDITFRILGASAPEGGRVRIYTVAGRLLREIPIAASELNIGFNRIHWDGRDADGSELANGVYFYTLRIMRGGRAVESVEKVAILR